MKQVIFKVRLLMKQVIFKVRLQMKQAIFNVRLLMKQAIFNVRLLMMSFQHYNDVTDRCAASMRLFVFYLCLGLVQVCEIEISHMGKNNGNPDLVCEKQIC